MNTVSFVFVFFIGIVTGIINKKLLMITVNGSKLRKKSLILSSISRIIIVSIFFFFIIKHRYNLSLPLFFGYFTSGICFYYKNFKKTISK